MQEFLGKYRAFVVDNNDPENQGRIKVQVPYISGESVIGWCLPCVPVAYPKGGDFNIPKLGTFVWVEFEHGDVRYPIYTGSLYGGNNTPITDKSKRLISWGSCQIEMSESSLILKCGSNKLTVTPNSVSVSSNFSASGTVSGSNI